MLLSSSFYFSFQPVHAQSNQTLAETINNVTNNIQNWDSPWTVLYGQIFSQTNQSVYDTAITQALNQNDYTDVIFIARLAEINGYTSQIINDSIVYALQNIPMVGSLPETYMNPDSFLLYDRYMVNAYRYAQELNVSGWNLTQATIDFVNAYLKPPENSPYGEMLCINPMLNFSESFSNRYYDEFAETLGMFLEFAEVGVNITVLHDGQALNVMSFMDDVWNNTQNLWAGNMYGYNLYEKEVECEMGNFAMIIAEYQNYRGENVPYFNRVIQDLEYTLLAGKFSSPAWSTVGVLKHAEDNPQQRLDETTGAIIALQMLYPYFNQDIQTNFQGMLQNGMWQGLINSPLFSNNQFQFVSNSGFCDDASSLGAMTLFLDGIVPQTGYLAINASNEAYQDYRTCFPTSEWDFNYQNQTIRIPVIAGNLSFVFGSQEVSQNFPSNGVYNIQFSSDWNNITSITKVTDINTVTLQATQRPKSSPIITPTPSPTAKPSPTPTLTPIFTPAPIQTTTPNLTATVSPSPTQKSSDTLIEPYRSLIILAISGVLIITTLTIYGRRNKK